MAGMLTSCKAGQTGRLLEGPKSSEIFRILRKAGVTATDRPVDLITYDGKRKRSRVYTLPDLSKERLILE